MRHNFIVVSEVATNKVIALYEGSNERGLKKSELEKIDEKMKKKHRDLGKKYPLRQYDVTPTRAENVNDLKRGYPELLGWEGAIKGTF